MLRGLRAVSALLAAIMLLGSGLTFLYYNRLTSQAGTAASVQDVQGNEAATGVDGRDMDILMIGTDTRTGTDIPAEEGAGDDLHNTDTIMLIHVPADGSRASIVSFPRDTWVTLPNGEKSKINSAYAYGWASVTDPNATVQQRKDAGQKWLVQTVNAFSGVQIDHFVEVTLAGFRDLTKAVGGVDVNLCAATKDPEYSGADFPAGKQHLNESQALSFVRQRHYLPNGDLDRIKRQQYFMAQILRKVLDRQVGDLLNPAKLGDLIDALAGTISFDRDLNPLMLAEQMRDVAAGNVEFRTVPLADSPFKRIGGQEVVLPADEDTLKVFFQTLSAPAPAKPAPTSSSAPASSSAPGSSQSLPRIYLYLGPSYAEAVSAVTADLTGRGYTVSSAAVADADPAATEIQYGAGAAEAAAALSAQLPGSVTREVTTTPSGTLVVLAGPNYPGLDSTATAAVAPPDITAASENCIY